MKLRKGYLFKRGKTFYACWFVGGTKYVKTTGQTVRKDAETVLADFIKPYLVEDEVRTLETVKARIEGAKGELATLDEQRNPPLTIKQAWSAYLDAPGRPDSGPRTLKQYEAEYWRFLRWIEGAHPNTTALRDATETHAVEYAKDLNGAQVSPGTFNQHIGFLQLLWRVLGKKAKLTGNPWESIRRKTLAPVSRRELTVEELKRVCLSAEGESRLLFALGIYTGLRLGDCATLDWGEVDLSRNLIRRVPMKVARRKRNPVLVPIHPALKGILSEIPPPTRCGFVLPKTAAQYRLDPSKITKAIQAHFERNGIRTLEQGTGFTTKTDKKGKSKQVHTGKRGRVEVGFHSLRHTFVSLCREAGAPLAVVESIVGHSNPSMTRHYTHVGELAAGQAVNALPSVMGDTVPALPPANPLERISEIAKTMTGKSWKTDREEIVRLTAMIK